MVLKAFAVHDQKSKAFNTPFFKHTHGEAERDFKSAVNDNSQQNNNLHKYPEDFDLYHVGEYDDQTGLFTPVKTPQIVIKAVAVKQ